MTSNLIAGAKERIMQHPLKIPHQELPNLYLGIVDFDSPIYRCSAVHNDDEISGLESAKLTLLRFVQENIVNPTRCDDYLFVITGENNFRHERAVSKPYKGQRQQDKPIHYLELRDWAIEQFGCLVSSDCEADDYAVSCHTRYQGQSVLIGMDKDNFQSPGWHFDYTKHIARYVSLAEAQYSLAYQLLRGDPGDNIPGLPGVGEAKAAAILDNATGAFMKVARDEYVKRHLHPYYYTEQFDLLYMLRDLDVDFEGWFIQLEVNTKDGFEEEEGDFEGFDEETTTGVEL